MAEHAVRIAARRRLRDRLATGAVRGAGITVLVSISLMLAYLVYICLPLASPSRLGEVRSTVLDPSARFVIREADGRRWHVPIPPGGLPIEASDRVLASGGQALLATGEALHLYDLVPSAPGEDAVDGVPVARWRGTLGIAVADPGSLVFDSSGGRALVGFRSRDGKLHAVSVTERGGELDVARQAIDAGDLFPATLLVDATAGRMLLVRGDRYLRWQLAGLDNFTAGTVHGGQLTGLGEGVTVAAWGPGRETLVVVTSGGDLHRFDTARRALPRLGPPRSYGVVPRWVRSEGSRRVTAILGTADEFLLVVPSTGEALLRTRLTALRDQGELMLSADGSYLVALSAERELRWPIASGSPDTGWRSLWLAQHYGGYDGAVHSWHPEGAAIGVLPKYSLSPLLWGTFKAAVYGMLLAVPLALGAAIYAGYFLPPRRRNQVKPAVEMLEAFPTVVLGFIFGLWAAPILEDYLVAVLLAPLLCLVLPLILALSQRLLQRLVAVRLRPPRLLWLFVAYVVGGGILFAQADALEALFFDGSLRDWLWVTFGLHYDQRNALLVGLAMGLAITPVMFSIIEDAINAVPRSLSDGSLALGATRWQSLARVVLPAASPAILSAILIGFARGLGETMIVLLATGNAPIMTADPFSGLRTLAASIAAELPEADAGGEHFRLLFLAALVLFALTFLLNTVAELFRQRLRYAYAGR